MRNSLFKVAIKEALAAHHLSVAELARKARLPASTVRNYMTRQLPKVGVMPQLCEPFNMETRLKLCMVWLEDAFGREVAELFTRPKSPLGKNEFLLIQALKSLPEATLGAFTTLARESRESPDMRHAIESMAAYIDPPGRRGSADAGAALPSPRKTSGNSKPPTGSPGRTKDEAE